MSAEKPTPAQVRFMENLIAGRPCSHGCRTMSDWGGLNSTQDALAKRGWVAWPHIRGSSDPWVTEKGYQALEAYYGESVSRAGAEEAALQPEHEHAALERWRAG